MVNKEVIPAFDILLEELETIIPELNKQGAQLMEAKRYPEAHSVINKAQAVIAFQDEVKALREKWLRLEVPSIRQTTPAPKPRRLPKKNTRVTLFKLEEGLRTKNKEFHIPILQVLVNHGGEVDFSKLIEELKKELAGVLNPVDWETLSDGKTIRWVNNVGWAKARLRNDGYISATAPIGTWQITEKGRQVLEESKKKQ